MAEKSKKSTTLVFFVNGKKVIDTDPDPECTLLTYLRDKLHLCGTKLGCAEGGCGACTAMISKFNRTTKEVKHLAVNACLTPVCSLHGLSVTTVEGIGSTRTRLHPVQERIAKSHGSQCGFCTPGIVMSMYALLRSSPTPSMKDLEVAFQGNLCRCTGYRPIIEGYKTFTAEYKSATCPMGEKCCKVNNGGCGPDNDSDKLFEPSKFVPFDQTQEPIFPPELKVNAEYDDQVLSFVNKDGISWERPTTLKDLLTIKKDHPTAKIIVGNTEVGVEVKFKHCVYPMLVNPAKVIELNKIEVHEKGIRFGAAITLMQMEEVLQKEIDSNPEHETRLFVSIVKMLHYFAGKQIRNVASVGGNIMTGSPISDLNPIFTAAGIELEVESLDRGRRILRKGKGFYTGYRKNIIELDEVLISICIQKTGKYQYFEALKQAKRRDDDIAIVNGAFNVIFEDGTDIIKDIHFAFGGMAPTTVLAPETSKAVIGKKWNSEIVEIVNQNLLEELPLSGGAPGGMILYRRSLTLSLFFKAFLKISQSLEATISDREPISNRETSGADVFHTLTPKSSQLFEKPPEGQESSNPMRKPLTHSSAFKQATGEAVYCDDIPRFQNELYLGMVLSTKAHAKLISVDATEALQQPGVHAFFSKKDISDDANHIGAVFHDEELFVKDKVTCQGQLIGVVIAESQKTAQRAARLVKVVYEDLTPIIVTLEDAIEQKSFFPNYPQTIEYGDYKKAFADADHLIEGEFRIGGQEHFYLETNASVAIPKDNDELEIFCSSQHPTEIQKLAASVLEIPVNRVVARAKRLGGGFGGKESRGTLVALPVAFAAYKLGRPVRLMLDRDEDMMITGTRHPFYFKWKVSFTKIGEITGIDIEIYNNAGCTMDLSFSVLQRAMFHFQCCYRFPNVRVRGWVCRTNLPSNTAFRGFGGPQGMMAGENIIRQVAAAVGKDYMDIQRLNMFVEGDSTHYNHKLTDYNMMKCFDGVIKSSDFENRKLQVQQFNKENRWRKRGISLTNTLFGIGFTALHLNQSGALVHVYIDGSVLLNHGGVEMGQGLHIKMIQVAAATLQIPAERIHIAETSTDKVPNTSPTAASAGSDLNGMAVLNACQIILDRLSVYKAQAPNDGWDKWINKAYFDRVSLSATGFYATPMSGYNFDTNSGQAFNYFTYGSAISEIELDCLTGDHQVIRTDILMDLGSSINPAIDIGQIEGAFMQGYGLFTLEELIYSPTGTLYSRGPGMYKLPGFADIPGEFNVSLLTGAKNKRAVFSSKAVGEPPLFLASSIFFAIKEAISAARKEEKLEGHFKLDSPATASRIRMACTDKFTKLIKEDTTAFVPWNVVP